MIKNYLKTAWRHSLRHKSFTFINVFGLTVGITCAIIIFMFVSDELSFDRYHEDLDNIFRVAVRSESVSSVTYSATVCSPVARVLRDNFPQVDKVAQVFPIEGGFVQRGDVRFFEETRIFADPEIFQILSIPFVEGASSSALDRPYTIVLSARMAEKYFGKEEALGKTILINSRDYVVTGVVKDPPHNTHFKYAFFISMTTLEGRYPFDRWFLSNFYIYTKLHPQADKEEFGRSLAGIADVYAPKELMNPGDKIEYFLQPIKGIHLMSHLRNEIEPGTNPLYLYLLSAVGLFVLLIACMNYINLCTARAANRYKEVGVRKVAGANRWQLIVQFMSESGGIIVCALISATVLVSLILPLFNSLAGKAFSERDMIKGPLLLFIVLLGIFVSIVASAYPAFFLSMFQPAKILRAGYKSGARGSTLRKLLVVGQFSLSIALIAGTLVMSRQIHYMKNQYLGFDKEQKLIVPVRGILSLSDNSETVKSAFLQHPSVLGVSFSSHVIGQKLGRWDTEYTGSGVVISRVLNHLYVGPDFIHEYDITLIAGRAFSREFTTDQKNTVIINRTAAAEFGWTPNEALGKHIESVYSGDVIGVIEDFHYQGLQTMIEPLALFWIPEGFSVITLRLNTTELTETLAFLKEPWQTIYPGYPMEYDFFDTQFDRVYHSEERMGKILTVSTVLALFIACLGLFGLASSTAERKTKEIGIRKVLGATSREIMVLLIREIVKWVLYANVIAWPLSYAAMNIWLKNFAYRIDIGVGILALSALVGLGIALITISYQSAKAAVSSPVKALKYE